MATPGASAAIVLGKQFRCLQKEDQIDGISVGLVDSSVFDWNVMLMINDECKLYGGGFFRARMTFPKEYPLQPPKLKFLTKIWHPNVYPDGNVCISILHPPGDDIMGYEAAAERWSPVQTPASILLSVISMLSSPNPDSPANVDAAKQFREDFKAFKRAARKCVNDSLEC